MGGVLLHNALSIARAEPSQAAGQRCRNAGGFAFCTGTVNPGWGIVYFFQVLQLTGGGKGLKGRKIMCAYL